MDTMISILRTLEMWESGVIPQAECVRIIDVLIADAKHPDDIMKAVVAYMNASIINRKADIKMPYVNRYDIR